MIRFLNNIFFPSAPVGWNDALVLILTSATLTVLTWYVCSVIVSWSRPPDPNPTSWSVLSLRTRSYLDGALLTAATWTFVIGYCFFRARFDMWTAAIAHWAGLTTALVLAALLLVRLRARILHV